MPNYIRSQTPVATFFFTVVTNFRRPILRAPGDLGILSGCFEHVLGKHPVKVCAEVILPDHIHSIWEMPQGDADFSMRWRLVKNLFTQRYLASGGEGTDLSHSRILRKEKGVWQRRFWEHQIRDETECERLCDYIHYNPVKHSLAKCAHDWEASSFHRFVQMESYPPGWGCQCCGSIRMPEWVFDGCGVAGEP